MSKPTWLARFATAVTLTLLYFCAATGPVAAASSQGKCCADLEERIAELEASAATKGNRKVTVTVYGQINKGMMWVDAFDYDDSRVIDGATSPTFFGFVGQARINSNWTAGYKLEFGINDQAIKILDDELQLRHSYWWIEGPYGKASVGFTSMATDGIAHISVANTEVASRMLSLQPISSAYLFGIDLPFSDLRRQVVRYDTPSFGGFQASASWARGDAPLNIALAGFVDDREAWDLALRYAGEFSGFRIAGGIGFSEWDGSISPLLGIPQGPERVVSGSLSAFHVQSGIFGNVGAGWVTDDGLLGDYTAIHLQGGWQKNVTGLGATTLYAEHAFVDLDDFGPRPTMFGLGAVQAIDAAALDLYVAWRRYDLDLWHDDVVNTFMTGARIRF